MTPHQKLLYRMKRHKEQGKKVLSVDYVIQSIESDINREASTSLSDTPKVGAES